MKKSTLMVVFAVGAFALVVSSAAAVRVHWFAGSRAQPVALYRAPVPGDALPTLAARAARQRGLDTSQSRMVAAGTFLVPKGDSELCLIGVRGDEMTGGCSPSNSFLANGPLNVGVYERGGPGARSFTVAGVAAEKVSAVRVMFGDSGRSVRVSPSGGFAYTANAATSAPEGPTAVVALDAAGNTIATQDLNTN